MRTVILLGLNLIARAIVQSAGIDALHLEEFDAGVVLIALFISILMDIFDFIKNMIRK